MELFRSVESLLQALFLMTLSHLTTHVLLVTAPRIKSDVITIARF